MKRFKAIPNLYAESIEKLNYADSSTTVGILRISTVLNKVVWPIAILKFNGKDAYCWDWMTGGPGHLLLTCPPTLVQS
jgi:hypothetical protein